MTGPEHYKAAENLLQAAVDLPRPVAAHDYLGMIQTAQVHATLALAAATASPLVHQMCGDSNRTTDWGNAIGWDSVPRPVRLVSEPDAE